MDQTSPCITRSAIHLNGTACNTKISPAVAAAEEMCGQLQHSKTRLMVISANSNNMYDSQSCAAKN